MAERDYSPYQRKIIKRYYDNHDGIQLQRLSDMAAELYLANDRKKEKLWAQAREILERMGLPAARIEHVLAVKDPALLPGLVKELDAKLPPAK
jgi:ATP/maltotriose-dependent transcriptional regulator MalT